MMRTLASFLTTSLLLASLACSQLIGQQGAGPGPGLGKPPGAGASDFVTDSFTEASGTPTLSSHTPELGGAITAHPAAAYTSTVTLDSSVDEIFPNGTTSYYYAATPPSADYYVQFDLHTITIENANGGGCGHVDTTADSMVCARINNGTTWELFQRNAGSSSTLATSTTGLPTAGSTRVVKLTFASGGTTAAIAVDGATVISATSIAITAAGKVGVRFSGGVSVNTGFHLDNMSAR